MLLTEVNGIEIISVDSGNDEWIESSNVVVDDESNGLNSMRGGILSLVNSKSGFNVKFSSNMWSTAGLYSSWNSRSENKSVDRNLYFSWRLMLFLDTFWTKSELLEFWKIINWPLGYGNIDKCQLQAYRRIVA